MHLCVYFRLHIYKTEDSLKLIDSVCMLMTRRSYSQCLADCINRDTASTFSCFYLSNT
jgi:hypothetical protein